MLKATEFDTSKLRGRASKAIRRIQRAFKKENEPENELEIVTEIMLRKPPLTSGGRSMRQKQGTNLVVEKIVSEIVETRCLLRKGVREREMGTCPKIGKAKPRV